MFGRIIERVVKGYVTNPKNLKRLAKYIIGHLKDMIDEPHEQEALIDWLNGAINLPIIDSAEERKLFEALVKFAYNKLEKIEAML